MSLIRDEELCRQVQEGNEGAMEALVHRHYRSIYAYLYRMTGNHHAAEDLAQESFVRLMTRINTYRFPEPFKPWLFTISHNLYKDAYKAPVKNSPPPSPPPGAAEAVIERLRLLMPKPQPARFRTHGLVQQPVLALLHTLPFHVRLFRPIWWLVSLAIVLGGLIASPLLQAQGIPLTAFAPLLVIGGVAYSFHTLKGGSLEIELSCPISPAQSVLGRILIMMGYYLILGALVALIGPGTVGVTLLSWTAALFLFSGLMLGLTMWTGTVSASTYALVLWGSQVALRELGMGLFAMPGAPHWMLSQVAALLIGLALMGYTLRTTSLYLLLGRSVS